MLTWLVIETNDIILYKLLQTRWTKNVYHNEYIVNELLNVRMQGFKLNHSCFMQILC